jgi:hypothetical protein
VHLQGRPVVGDTAGIPRHVPMHAGLGDVFGFLQKEQGGGETRRPVERLRGEALEDQANADSGPPRQDEATEVVTLC